MQLTLNKRRTFLIAFAFFAILMLWQVYYYYVPLYLDNLLTQKFGVKNWSDIIGHIMSLDNLSAIIIIPLFGWLSDRTKTRLGRRIPYIICGSLLSLALFPLICVMYIMNQFAWYFVVVVLLVFSMAAFRSPAVALMPDTTPKPLRTPANAIINFVGYLGAIIGSGLTIIFTMKNETLTIVPFAVTSVMLAVVIVVFLLRFRENRVVESVKAELLEGERQSETIEAVNPDQPLSRRDKFNFGVIIACVFFCWFAFTALQTFGSLYGERVLHTDKWGMCTTALAVASLATFLPSIWLSKHIGRKWSVVLGLGIVIVAIVVAALFATKVNFMLVVALFALSGIGWAIVMVNSYPMFVEMSTSKNVGRITGIYYFVSQGAMFLTSNVSGYVFKWLGLEVYFYYAIAFMSLAFVICFFFRQKRTGARPEKVGKLTTFILKRKK